MSSAARENDSAKCFSTDEPSIWPNGCLGQPVNAHTPGRPPTRKALLSVALLVSIAACSKTGENEFQVKTPDVNVSTDTHTVRTPDVDIGTKTDTLNVPVVGTQKDTIVIDKPVAGTKQTEVKTPTVRVTKP